METTPLQTRTIRIDPRRIKLLDLNAHYMRHEVFARLVDNLRRDGTLAGDTPFGWRLHDDTTQLPVEPETYEVLSGNHRVKASIAADLPEIDFVITDEYLPPERRKSIQLSRNAVVGEDDPAILKTIYESIGDVGMRLYTGLDDQQLNLLATVAVAPMSEASLEFQSISLTFLPHEVQKVLDIWDDTRRLIAGAKGYWLARWEDYDRAMDALEAAGQAYNIRNTATALMIVLDIFYRHLDELTDGFLDPAGEAINPKQAVPIASVLGLTLPARLAAKIKKLPGDDKLAALEAILDEHLKADR